MDIVPYSQNNLISSYVDVEKAAKAMAGSGFFSDTRQVSQAIVKIMAGAELGVGAFASMTGVNIIQGKPAFSANLMASSLIFFLRRKPRDEYSRPRNKFSHPEKFGTSSLSW